MLSLAWIRTRFAFLPIAVFFVAVLARLAFMPSFHGFQYDMYIFGDWARTLVQHPWSRFYNIAESPDHLPGDLYFHALLAELFKAVGGGDYQGEAYRSALKLSAVCFDIMTSLVLFALVRRLAGHRRAQVAMLAWIANPAIAFLSAAWGQWDALSGLLLVAGILLLCMRNSVRLVSGIPLAWAVLIKPPLMLPIAFIVFGSLFGNADKQTIRRQTSWMFALGAIAFATVTLLMLPFDMSWSAQWARWTLVGRLRIAQDLYPNTTLGAANIWMIPLGRPKRVSDLDSLLGVSYQQIGTALFIGGLVWILWRWFQESRHSNAFAASIWAACCASYAFFMLPTRSHERYVFPAILLLTLLYAICPARRLRHLVVIASGAYLLNMIFVYKTPSAAVAVPIFELLSLTNIVAFCALLMPAVWGGLVIQRDGEIN